MVQQHSSSSPCIYKKLSYKSGTSLIPPHFYRLATSTAAEEKSYKNQKKKKVHFFKFEICIFPRKKITFPPPGGILLQEVNWPTAIFFKRIRNRYEDEHPREL